MTKKPLAGRLMRFRVMALITGSFLLIVFVGLLRYLPGVNVPDWLDKALGTVAQIHGMIFMIYLVVSFMLWSMMTWSMRRLFIMALGGIVPLLSFFLERRIAREVAAGLDA